VQKLKTKNPMLGAALAFTAAILFGLNASTSKIVMQAGVTPEQIVLFRSLATALIAAAVLVFTKPEAFKVRPSEWKFLISFGMIGVALMQWAYSNAVRSLPVGIALLIEYTAIIIVPLVAWVLFKEKSRRRLWIGVALVLTGLLIVSEVWNSTLNPVGVLFAFAAAIFLSVYFIMGERSHLTRDPISTLFYTMLISSVFWLVISPWWQFDIQIATSPLDLGGNLSGTLLPGWFMIIWIGILGSFLPMMLSFVALGQLNATGVGVISTAETIFAFLFGYLWLGEMINGLQMVGGVLVITGIVVAQLARGKKNA
jgi:drug/metabolite transporter (DMT)-like permease